MSSTPLSSLSIAGSERPIVGAIRSAVSSSSPRARKPAFADSTMPRDESASV